MALTGCKYKRRALPVALLRLMIPVMGAWEGKGNQWSLNHSVISSLCRIIHACSTPHSGELRRQNAPADPICTPSRFALSPTHKSPMQHKRVNDSLCFVAGNRPKANDNNKSIKLSSSEHISSFCQPTRGLKCTYCTLAPQAAGGPGTRQPLGGQRGLDKWLEQTCVSPVREKSPSVSYIILTALFFWCPLSIQRPVIGVMPCTG